MESFSDPTGIYHQKQHEPRGSASVVFYLLSVNRTRFLLPSKLSDACENVASELYLIWLARDLESGGFNRIKGHANCDHYRGTFPKSDTRLAGGNEMIESLRYPFER